jgi:3-oxoacyl-[acyl-carrier-protein] synthase II
MRKNRVVVTGLGVLAANGIGLDEFWSSLVAGRSGIRNITLFDATNFPCRIAGEVKGFHIHQLLGHYIPSRRLTRQDQLALAATVLALRDAGLDPKSTNAPPANLFIGVSCPAVELIESGFKKLQERGPDGVPVHVALSGQPHHAASAIASYVPFLSNVGTISSAGAAGADAVAAGVDHIRAGRADLVLAGGTDAPVNALTFASLAQAGLMTSVNDDPEHASRPFDIRRDAGIISEGAGMVVLERLEHAEARGARVYLEITGHAACLDTDPEIAGSGFEWAMRQALANASCLPEDVDYICAHGPSHRELDRVETERIKRVFGPAAYGIPVSSIKAVVGNPLAAACPMQLVACSLAMRDGLVPPTANLEEPDPSCDLDYVPHRARRATLNTILVNTHGLGGGNTCLVAERCAA